MFWRELNKKYLHEKYQTAILTSFELWLIQPDLFEGCLVTDKILHINLQSSFTVVWEVRIMFKLILVPIWEEQLFPWRTCMWKWWTLDCYLFAGMGHDNVSPVSNLPWYCNNLLSHIAPLRIIECFGLELNFKSYIVQIPSNEQGHL